MRTSIAYSVSCLLFAAECCAAGEVTFYTNRTTWLAAVGGAANVAEWRYYSSVLDAAAEVSGRPVVDQDIGGTLTFADAPIPFTLRCMEDGAHFIHRDSVLGSGVVEGLSIGRSNIHENDDMEITFTSGCVRAAGVLFFQNSAETGEQVRVYDTAGGLLATYSGLPAFIGIVSSTPIGKIEFDEAVGADDIGTTGIDIVDCTDPAAVRIFSNKDDWRLAADRFGTPEGLPVTDFVLSASTLADSDELTSPPANDANLGRSLTFSSFIPGFALRMVQPEAQWVFNDASWSTTYRPFLCVGRANLYEDDDFYVDVTGCTPAVGIELFDNTTITDELVLVYGSGGGLLGMLEAPATATNKFGFMGLISAAPIARIEFDEDSADDDIGLRNVSFITAIAATPSALDICQGGEGSLMLAAAIDVSNPRWRKDGVELSDGPTAWGSVISGATTPMLTIGQATLDDAGLYDCQTDSACGPTDAVSSLVRVCPSDFDCSGFVDTDDFTAFVHEFELGNDSADVDRTGFVDTDDFTYFVLAFESGC